MPYREKTIRCVHPGGFHDMVYSDWGSPWSETVVVCVHGLTRSGRDFDRLADALSSAGFRALAPDIVGRGRSGRLGPAGSYDTEQYIHDIASILAAEGLRQVDWIGTFMGGLIGIGVAAMAGHPIRRMLINDVGPFLPKTALERIGDYLRVAWRFDDFEAAAAHVRKAYEPFALKAEADWRYLAELSLRQDESGAWINTYDRRIANSFQPDDLDDVDLWSLWDSISVPVTVLRGVESDLLLRETARGMERRGPKATIVEIPDVGHAPALLERDQIELVLRWVQGV